MAVPTTTNESGDVIEIREVNGEKVAWNKTLGGPVVGGPDPDRVAGGIQAAKTRKKHEKEAEKEEAVGFIAPVETPEVVSDEV